MSLHPCEGRYEVVDLESGVTGVHCTRCGYLVAVAVADPELEDETPSVTQP